MSVTLLKHPSVGDRFNLGFRSKDGIQCPVSWMLSKGIPIVHSPLPPVDPTELRSSTHAGTGSPTNSGGTVIVGEIKEESVGRL